MTKDDTSENNAFGALTFTIVVLILPLRLIIQYYKKEVEEEENTRYSKMALTFPEDYDKENPLTVADSQ